MSRGIKFRYFNTASKEMIYDCGLLPSSHEASYSCGSDGHYINPSRDDKRILMQYTGLKDKNGKEIFDGDIVKTATDKNMVVGWSERFASFVIKREGWMFQHWFGEAFESTDCEIIGNIHENPELL